MPAPHSQCGFEETIYGLAGRHTSCIPPTRCLSRAASSTGSRTAATATTPGSWPSSPWRLRGEPLQRDRRCPGRAGGGPANRAVTEPLEQMREASTGATRRSSLPEQRSGRAVSPTCPPRTLPWLRCRCRPTFASGGRGKWQPSTLGAVARLCSSPGDPGASGPARNRLRN